jgi:hypothetical protein
VSARDLGKPGHAGVDEERVDDLRGDVDRVIVQPAACNRVRRLSEGREAAANGRSASTG